MRLKKRMKVLKLTSIKDQQNNNDDIISEKNEYNVNYTMDDQLDSFEESTKRVMHSRMEVKKLRMINS